MRVLMVSWEYPPRVTGGLGRHVGALVPALTALGHEIRVIGPAHSHELSPDRVIDQVTDQQRALIAAGLNATRDWTPDIVHSHDWLTATAALELSHATGAPLVTTVHATEHGRQQGYLTEPLQREIDDIERLMCRQSDSVLACSRYQADELKRLFGVDATVIGNGCVVGPTAPVAGRPRRIAFAGRLVHEKGLQELIKALPLLEPDYPDIHCMIVGDGPLAAAQRDRARRYQVADRIEWIGFLDQEATRRILAGAAVVVVPSLYEPFGLVALEAQAVGTPVAVTDTGGLRELVTDGVTGVRFAPENPAAIAEAVRRLFDDPEHTQAMANTAVEQAETRFSWSSVAQRTEAVYQGLRH